MNIDTGKVYRDLEEVQKAQERGERLTAVSEKVASLMEKARERHLARLRKTRLKARLARKRNRKRDEIAFESRRRNR